MTEELDLAGAVTVGRIVAAHGVRGEVRVEPTTDFPERFSPGNVLWLGGRSLMVERGRADARGLLLKLEGIDDREAADSLRGTELLAPPLTLEEGTYFLHQVIGLEVRETGGAMMGRVTEVLRTGANDVYVVRGERGELLLPATDDVVLDIDLERKRMTVDVPDGLAWGRPLKAPDRSRKSPRPARSRRPSPAASRRDPEGAPEPPGPGPR